MILNILEYYGAHPEKQMAMIFLDAKKDFDDVSWQFLIEQMKEMQFGMDFIKTVEAIYDKQKAKIVIMIT